MINTTLCYSATSGSSVADYDKLRRVDMGNVGFNGSDDVGFIHCAKLDFNLVPFSLFSVFH